MRHAVAVKLNGTWSGDVIASVTLPFEERHRRRIRMIDDGGTAFLLDLADAVRLSDGDGLVLDEGGMIVVRAARERVADLRCESEVAAMKLAWHIGNRHTPLQALDDGVLRIAYDHVLVEMAVGLGALAEEKVAPFEPEGGAYSSGHGHDH
jgi:urease accessory protein